MCCSAGALAAYFVALWLIGRSGPRLAHVAVLAAAIQLVPLAAPLLISSDPGTYWDYGRIAAVHDANPYTEPPSAFPDDPAYAYVGRSWRDTTSVYGPVFTFASEGVALVAGTSSDLAFWILRSLAALAVLATTGLAVFLARRRAFACAFVGWNPIVALHFAGGGHNDSLMIAFVMAALAAGAVGRRQWAGVAWVLAVLVKWIPLLFLPLRALEARTQGRRVGHLGFAVAAVGIAALAFWQFGWHWLGAARPLAENATRETSFAIPSRLEDLGIPEPVAFGLLAAAFVIGYVWLAREAWRGRARLGLTTCFVLLTTPYLAPWYVIWALPLAVVEEDRTAQVIILALCAYLLPMGVPITSR